MTEKNLHSEGQCCEGWCLVDDQGRGEHNLFTRPTAAVSDAGLPPGSQEIEAHAQTLCAADTIAPCSVWPCPRCLRRAAHELLETLDADRARAGIAPAAVQDALNESDTVRPVPKQPMVFRGFRVPEPLWEEAKAKADERGENISDVLRDALEKYVRRK